MPPQMSARCSSRCANFRRPFSSSGSFLVDAVRSTRSSAMLGGLLGVAIFKKTAAAAAAGHGRNPAAGNSGLLSRPGLRSDEIPTSQDLAKSGIWTSSVPAPHSTARAPLGPKHGWKKCADARHASRPPPADRAFRRRSRRRPSLRTGSKSRICRRPGGGGLRLAVPVHRLLVPGYTTRRRAGVWRSRSASAGTLTFAQPLPVRDVLFMLLQRHAVQHRVRSGRDRRRSPASSRI